MTTTKKVILLFMLIIGAILFNFNSRNLGDLGNTIMHISGTILLVSAVIISIISNSHKKQ